MLPNYQIHLLDLIFQYIHPSEYINWMLINKEFKNRIYFILYSHLNFNNLSFLNFIHSQSTIHLYCYQLDIIDVLDTSTVFIPLNWFMNLLANCPNLTILNLPNAWFLTNDHIMTDKYKQSLQYHNISSLNLSQTSLSSHKFIECLALFPSLKRLELTSIAINDHFKSYIRGNHLNALYELILDHNEDVNDDFLLDLLNHCRSLSKLSIAKTQVSDYGVSFILHLPHLWQLNIGFNIKITNQIFNQEIPPKLISFQAIGTNMVFNDDLLIRLSVHCLETLLIGYSMHYTNLNFMKQFNIPKTSFISTFSDELPIGNPQILPDQLKYFPYLKQIMIIVEDSDLYLPIQLIEMYLQMAQHTLMTRIIIIYKGHALYPLEIYSLNTRIRGPKYKNGNVIICDKQVHVQVYRDWIETSHVQFKLNS
eukprot:NODE_466_length_7077_cov_0.565205.p1 type:complete len:422 gc:universal NODE_466_length_7077_cov_0.565205:4175-2910(-)